MANIENKFNKIFCTSCHCYKSIEKFGEYILKNGVKKRRRQCHICRSRNGKYSDPIKRKKFFDEIKILRIHRKIICVNRLGGKCNVCEKVFPLCCYDFHHINPINKKTEIAKLIPIKSTTTEELFEEVDKCLLLCSNCHRILHSEEETKSQI
jgi:hypothetical protein